MESSNPSNLLYDPVRKGWVKKTPEEIIRQYWLQKMVQELDYPLSLLAVEKELKQLPHLQHLPSKSIPRRRIDVVVYAKGIHPDYPLFPLLLLECKAIPLTPAFARQAIGYNDIVKAPFVAVANKDQMLVGQYEGSAGMFQFTSGLPSYSILLRRIHDKNLFF